MASGSARLHHRRVLRRDQRPLGDDPHLLVVEQADRDRRAPDLEGIGPDHRAGQVLLDVRVHPLDDRDDDDQEADRDDDAEEGEEGPELGAPDGLERETEGLEEGHWREDKAGQGGMAPRWRYSYLNASTGSSREALLAG